LDEGTKDPLVLPTVQEESRVIGAVESPVITVSDIPSSLNVGDKVKPKVNVLRADKTTPIQNCPVDFFVADSLGTMSLGSRVLTDVNGDAIATEYYYVGRPEAGLTVSFIIVTRRILV